MKNTLNRKQFLTLTVTGATATMLGCASDGDDPMTEGTGGLSSTGGADSSSGGALGTGGTSATGGASNTGGATATGGTTATGGVGSGGDAAATGGDAATGGTQGVACASVMIEANKHMHNFTVTSADIEAGVEKIYTATGMHEHMVTVTAAHFTTLKTDGVVMVMQPDDGQHDHIYTLTCET